jgi:hypothetical protein
MSKENLYLQNEAQFTNHAITRMAQRNLSEQDIFYVLQNGQRCRCAGMLHCFLGKRNIPACDLSDSRYARLEGTTVLIDSKLGKQIITVYRNKAALKRISHKSKYHRGA